MPSFENINPVEEAEIPPAESVAQGTESILVPEYQETMERHKKGRLGLLKDMVTSRTIDIAANFVPGIDAPKLAIEGMLGKTLSNEKLTSRQRFDHMLIGGGIALSYALAAFGTPEAALAARSASSFIAKIEFGPEMMQEIAQKTKDKFPKPAAFLEKTASYFMDKREQFIQGVRRMGKQAEEYLNELEPGPAMI